MKPLLFSGGIPSNFYKAEIILPRPIDLLKEDSFPTNEHYFQACKVAISHAGTIDMYREIRDADSAAAAKRLGRAVPLDDSELNEWNNYEAIVSMLQCNLAKYTQNLECKDWLLSTLGRHLVEHRRDPIWGDNMDGTGENLLGKTLELVRATL